MKIVIVGASGTIGQELVKSLENENEIVKVGFSKGDYTIDMTSQESIENMFKQIGDFDAVISAAGDAKFAPLNDLSYEDYEYTFKNKLMGQVNLYLTGRKYAKPNTSFTFTSGILAHEPMEGSAAVSMINSGLEAFAKAAALESGDIRINVVSPVFAKETLDLWGMDSTGATAAKEFVPAYKASYEETGFNGKTILVSDYI